MKKRVLCHKMIADVACGIAEEVYEDMASDNNFYKVWPKRNVFVKKNWSKFIMQARKALSMMLTSDEYPETTKEMIFDALVKDKSLENPVGNV